MLDERRETGDERVVGLDERRVNQGNGIGFEQIKNLLPIVREKKPLVHCITNYVTANDCANAILAIGASPIMADDLREVADIVKISKALVLNIGTLNARTVESMIAAGKKANALNIPVIFDPVGAGASAYRNESTQRLLQSVRMTVIRGNLSEMSFIAGLDASTKGVDSAEEDSSKDPVAIANKVAKEYNCVAAITGVIDTISDGQKVYRLKNGVADLARVTGTGCMTTALIGALCGTVFASRQAISATNVPTESSANYFIAAIAGIATMGIAGELAKERLTPPPADPCTRNVSENFAAPTAQSLGTGSFRIALIDALSQLEAATLVQRLLPA